MKNKLLFDVATFGDQIRAGASSSAWQIFAVIIVLVLALIAIGIALLIHFNKKK